MSRGPDLQSERSHKSAGSLSGTSTASHYGRTTRATYLRGDRVGAAVGLQRRHDGRAVPVEALCIGCRAGKATRMCEAIVVANEGASARYGGDMRVLARTSRTRGAELRYAQATRFQQMVPVISPLTQLRLRMRAQQPVPTLLLNVESSSDAHSCLPVCCAWEEDVVPG